MHHSLPVLVQGTFRALNGEEYNGAWLSDMRHGRGTFKDAEGNVYEVSSVFGPP